MMKVRFEFFAKTLSIVSIIFVTYSVAVNELHFQDGSHGKLNFSWNYLSESQEIEFEVRAKTTGYVAIGLTKTNSGMQNLDIFVGGVKSGNSYLKDYYANGKSEPPEDSQQDYTLISASESNGVTMVLCKRKLNTQDVEDFLIKPGDPVYIAWSYYTTAGNTSDDFTWHSYRGYSSQMHVLVPEMTTSSPSPTTVGPTSVVHDTTVASGNGSVTTLKPSIPSTSTTTTKRSAAMATHSVVVVVSFSLVFSLIFL